MPRLAEGRISSDLSVLAMASLATPNWLVGLTVGCAIFAVTERPFLAEDVYAQLPAPSG